MTYPNLTREMLDKTRALKTPATAPDGAWLDWPHPVETKKPKQVKTSRTGRYRVANALKPGSGKYS